VGMTFLLWLFQLFLAHVIFRDRDYPNVTVSIDNRCTSFHKRSSLLLLLLLSSSSSLAVRNVFSTSHLYFSADLTRSVCFNLLLHCHCFPYLVLVFVFNCILGNRYLHV